MLTLADHLTAVLSEDSLDVYWLTHSNSRVYIKLVLPELPVDAELVQAQLTLSVAASTAGNPVPRISAHYGQGVDLGAITGEFPVEPGPTAAPHLGRQAGHEDTWDVTALLEGRFGSELLIVIDPPVGSGGSWAYWFAHEGFPDDSERPVLLIEYASPVRSNRSSFGRIKTLH
jgi:hypothetical protein